MEQPQSDSTDEQATSTVLLPFEIIDKTIDKQVRVVLQANNREFVGKLVGFDDFVNVIIQDSKEYVTDNYSSTMGEPVSTHTGRLLLNGNNIAMIVPISSD